MAEATTLPTSYTDDLDGDGGRAFDMTDLKLAFGLMTGAISIEKIRFLRAAGAKPEDFDKLVNEKTEDRSSVISGIIKNSTPEQFISAVGELYPDQKEIFAKFQGDGEGLPELRQAIHGVIQNPELLKTFMDGKGTGNLDLSKLVGLTENPDQMALVTKSLNHIASNPASMAHLTALTTAYGDGTKIDFKAAKTAMEGLGFKRNDIIQVGLQASGIVGDDANKIMDALNQHPDFKQTLMDSMFGNPARGIEGDSTIISGLAGMMNTDGKKDGLFSVDQFVQTMSNDDHRKALQGLIAKVGEFDDDKYTFGTITNFATSVNNGRYEHAAGILEGAGIEVPADLRMGAKISRWTSIIEDLSQMDNGFGKILRGLFKWLGEAMGLNGFMGPNSTIGGLMSPQIHSQMAGFFERNAELQTINTDNPSYVQYLTDDQFRQAFNEQALAQPENRTVAKFTETFQADVVGLSGVRGARDEMRGLQKLLQEDRALGIQFESALNAGTEADIENRSLKMYQAMREGQSVRQAAVAFTNG